nr:MAG TPA: hypothetical protein [Caudoviricetes sp.]DAL32810.1 MAG TPA_asm: hypothetical protein [Bacteriophage sp.]DAL65137.1 MAG TPA_asm: hypothetical protein [Caudoviricetes sp.]
MSCCYLYFVLFNLLYLSNRIYLLYKFIIIF